MRKRLVLIFTMLLLVAVAPPIAADDGGTWWGALTEYVAELLGFGDPAPLEPSGDDGTAGTDCSTCGGDTGEDGGGHVDPNG